MKTATIKYLAHAIKEGKSKPIFFLGAGASKTGQIPLANEIVKDILTKYPDHPLKDSDETIKDLKDKTYTNLMDCLSPETRNKLLKGYIDKAKINVTHIYLAQLMVNNYVDYVLTVNFDNLMLRALALYNEFPPIYDMAILKDLTTTAPPLKSVIYLHGQHHGEWLLNTKEEMAKVKDTISSMLNSIKDRSWVFIGYSGEDPILEHIKKMGRFNKQLYWVAYKDEEPSAKVCDALFNKSNTEAYLIKGDDADSFMLRLNSELNLPQPQILENPFYALGKELDSIVDIEDKEPYKGVKQRLDNAKAKVKEAVQQFEKTEVEIEKKKIIDFIIAKNYQADEISEIAAKVKSLNNPELDDSLANLYFNWGIYLGNLATNEAESLYKQAIEKFQWAIAIKPDLHEAFYNCGIALEKLAATKSGAEPLYKQAFEKYQQAIDIKPDKHEAFYNWGTCLGKLADSKSGTEAESLYNQAFEKYQQAITIKPDDHKVFNNWGTYLGKLADSKSGSEAKSLYNQALEKTKKAVELGGSCYNLACSYVLTSDKENALFYLKQSLENGDYEAEFVQKDEDWKNYLEDEDFKRIINN